MLNEMCPRHEILWHLLPIDLSYYISITLPPGIISYIRSSAHERWSCSCWSPYEIIFTATTFNGSFYKIKDYKQNDPWNVERFLEDLLLVVKGQSNLDIDGYLWNLFNYNTFLVLLSPWQLLLLYLIFYSLSSFPNLYLSLFFLLFFL